MKRVVIYILILVFVPLVALGGELGSFGEVSLGYEIDDSAFLFTLMAGLFYQQNQFKHSIFFKETAFVEVGVGQTQTVGEGGYSLGCDIYELEIKKIFNINFKSPPEISTVFILKIVW